MTRAELGARRTDARRAGEARRVDAVPKRGQGREEPSQDGEPAPAPGTESGARSVDVREPTSVTARSRWFWPLVTTLLLALAGGGYYWYRHGASEKGKGAATAERSGASVPVKVAEARTTDLPVYLTGLGTVQAFNTVLVRSRVDGEITQIAFTEGQIVHKGDLLAQIDPRPYKAALDQAIARKAQDEATLANTRRDLERTTQLGEFATRQQRDTQTAGVTSQSAQIQFDQATIDNAQTQLGYATIRAPITGRTGLRLVDQGNIVRASDQTGIVEIAQIQPIAVLFTAPQEELPGIAEAFKRGPVPVTALRSDGTTVLAEGELALVNNAIDAASGTIRLKATFANAEEKLWPGLSVDTRLLVRTLPQVVTVPADAVQRGQSGLYGYVVGADDKAGRRDFKVGPITDGQAVIEEGVKAGERVVISGHYRVTDGAKVEVGDGDRPKDARSPERGQQNEQKVGH